MCMSFEDLTCTKGATGVACIPPNRRHRREHVAPPAGFHGDMEPKAPARRSRMAPGRVLTCLPRTRRSLVAASVPTCARERSTRRQRTAPGTRRAHRAQAAGWTPTERPDRPDPRGRRGSYGEVSAPRWRSWGSSIAAWTSSENASPIPAPTTSRMRLRFVSEPASERTATPAHPDA